MEHNENEKQERNQKFARHKAKKRPNPIAKDLLQSGLYQPRIIKDYKKAQKHRQSLQEILRDAEDNE